MAERTRRTSSCRTTAGHRAHKDGARAARRRPVAGYDVVTYRQADGVTPEEVAATKAATIEWLRSLGRGAR